MIDKIMHGVVNGKTIELAEDPGVPSGQEIEIVLKAVPLNSDAWGLGLRRCAGALADEWSDEDDRILESIYQERKFDSRREFSE